MHPKSKKNQKIIFITFVKKTDMDQKQNTNQPNQNTNQTNQTTNQQSQNSGAQDSQGSEKKSENRNVDNNIIQIGLDKTKIDPDLYYFLTTGDYGAIGRVVGHAKKSLEGVNQQRQKDIEEKKELVRPLFENLEEFEKEVSMMDPIMKQLGLQVIEDIKQKKITENNIGEMPLSYLVPVEYSAKKKMKVEKEYEDSVQFGIFGELSERNRNRNQSAKKDDDNFSFERNNNETSFKDLLLYEEKEYGRRY